MMKSLFDGGDLPQLRAGLEVAWRQQLQADNNLVNAETPGFHARDTDFRAVLMSKGNPARPRGEAFQLYLDALGSGSGFSLERELGRLNEATLESDAYSQLLSLRYQDLRNVIREGH